MTTTYTIFPSNYTFKSIHAKGDNITIILTENYRSHLPTITPIYTYRFILEKNVKKLIYFF